VLFRHSIVRHDFARNRKASCLTEIALDVSRRRFLAARPRLGPGFETKA
jgi:hypothetical protein